MANRQKEQSFKPGETTWHQACELEIHSGLLHSASAYFISRYAGGASIYPGVFLVLSGLSSRDLGGLRGHLPDLSGVLQQALEARYPFPAIVITGFWPPLGDNPVTRANR